MTTETPLYKHPCDACLYLGTRDAHDLYLHECAEDDAIGQLLGIHLGFPTSRTTLIARHGNEPGDFYCGSTLIKKHATRALDQAWELAHARGLAHEHEIRPDFKPLALMLETAEVYGRKEGVRPVVMAATMLTAGSVLAIMSLSHGQARELINEILGASIASIDKCVAAKGDHVHEEAPS